MKALYQAPLKVKPSTIQGMGVFADADLEANSVIEECHILLMDNLQSLRDYVFGYKDGEKFKHYLPLGFGAIYNHSPEPNAEYKFNDDMTRIVFTTTKPIRAGEEIMVRYGNNWFAHRNIKPVQLTLQFRLKRLLAEHRFLSRGVLVTAAIMMGIYLTH